MNPVTCGSCRSVSFRGELPPSRCAECPPLLCPDCGNMDSIPAPCSCWVAVADLPLADQKALFAADGTFNVETDGRLTVGES